MKVLVADRLSEEGVELLRKDFDVDVKTGMKPDELIACIGEYDALVVRSATKVTADVLQAAKKLKIVGRAGVGVDNIDVDEATRSGVIVCNAPEGNTVAAAEHAVAMMCSLARNIPAAYASLSAGRWEKSKFMGVELAGKTLGVVGMGRIGTEVVRRGRGLGMNVLVYDPYTTAETARNQGAVKVELDELLSHADFVTIHAPKLDSTVHMFNRETFAKMKDGSRLINCARGGIVDEAALVEAVESGKVAGAALDVFEKEPLDPESPLLKCDRIVVTPHLGASTAEAQVSVATMIAEQVRAGLNGLPVSTAINIPSVSAERAELLRPYAELAEILGKVAVQLIDGSLQGVEIRYTGELVRGDVSLLTRAALKGVLSPVVGPGVNYVNALVLAEQRKIKVEEVKGGAGGDYTNLVEVKVQAPDCERAVSGSVFADNEPHILNIDGKSLDAMPTGYMVITHHKDRPGVIGLVGSAFGEADINIAGMFVGRDRVRGDAVMILTVDDPVQPEMLELIRKRADLYEARYVAL